MNYKETYANHFGLCADDWIVCERCGATASDIHHIENKGTGGSKTKDGIRNLIALCRNCHDWAHSPNTRQKQTGLKKKHEEFMEKFEQSHIYPLK